MKRSIGLWQLMGFAVTCFVGTVLHFLYDWLGETVWVAPFSGVNESTWEHMKLLFWPMLLFAAVQRVFIRDRADFWCVKLRGVLRGLVMIPVLFYTYNGAIGRSPDWINITIFFIAAALAYLREMRLFRTETLLCRSSKSAVAVLLVLALLFVMFTFAAPGIGIFRDPLTGGYGMA